MHDMNVLGGGVIGTSLYYKQCSHIKVNNILHNALSSFCNKKAWKQNPNEWPFLSKSWG